MMRVTITGTGTPIMVPGRAGPGVVVQIDGGTVFQFDVGRGTTLRLTEAGVKLPDITAVFVTHHHSDHLVGLSDLAMSHWLEQQPEQSDALRLVAPDGPAADIAERVLEPWQPEMTLRAAHTGRSANARIEVTRFEATEAITPVFASGEVTVSAIQVRHEPVIPAVAYRIDTPAGSVAISGDTAVCPNLERIATGASVLVQEAFHRSAIPDGLLSDPEAIAEYHSELSDIGEMADRAGVGTLMLTHLIPPPQGPEDKVGFVNEIKRAGYHGPVVVADDLDTIGIALHER
ncbi:MAG: MBL fold metallo-hydrolase [bacterium]|nr:MBL fold metallo-hydrolase [bacterium]